VIIPARFGSTRFAAKILASQTGKPLVQHVVEQARKCRRVRDVIVATDDQRIVDALRPFETKAVMTATTHQSGTDRIAEVARNLDDEIVVNVQGDEPEIEPETIDALIERLQTSSDDMATAATPFAPQDDPTNPNLVKVVMSPEGRAIYFSRSAIPFYRDNPPPSPGTPGEGRGEGKTAWAEGRGQRAGEMRDASGSLPSSPLPRFPSSSSGPHPNSLLEYRARGQEEQRARGQAAAYYLHLGIYAYRRKFLLEFSSWSPTPLEQAEKLEQLRALEHGKSIYVLKINRAVHGIDTEEQYLEFVERYKGVRGRH
jgi:3-deoxy-manno-octulosonate cytidylyltransferase (CMP-KDO synthetase)